jgi:hypothetical protein
VRYRLDLTVVSATRHLHRQNRNRPGRAQAHRCRLAECPRSHHRRRPTVRRRAHQAAKVQTSGTEFAGFAAASAIPAGPAQLRIEYHGAFNKNGSDGLFKLQDGGEWYVYSQFESIDARKAFPCFDEPNFKTPWQLTLHVNKSDAAVSNTPVQSETDEPGGRKKVVFGETKPLPSYLVALGVGPFDFVDAGKAGKNHTPLRMITPKGKAAQAKYAAEVTGPLLAALEDYFGVPYPYEKLDILSVPLFGGAMENAGLITCAQSLMLRDPAQDSIDRQRDYALVVAHEMAHQWFGDLVTTAWWDDIWLNEAFASWMDSKIMRHWKPEWNTVIDEQNTRLGAMGGDELVSARKIRQPIESNDDIANAFDGITYSKGEAVIGMFENWMGEDAFRRGVQRYIRQYAWRNATAGDFLDALSSAGSQPVGRAFSTFLDQAGVPLVSVGLSCGAGAGPPASQPEARAAFGIAGFHAADLAGSGVRALRRRRRHASRVYPADGSVHGLETGGGQELPRMGGGQCRWEGLLPHALRRRSAGQVARRRRRRLSAAERVAALGDVDALTGMGEIKSADALALALASAGDPVRQVVESAAASSRAYTTTWFPRNCGPTTPGWSTGRSARGRANWAGKRKPAKTPRRACCASRSCRWWRCGASMDRWRPKPGNWPRAVARGPYRRRSGYRRVRAQCGGAHRRRSLLQTIVGGFVRALKTGTSGTSSWARWDLSAIRTSRAPPWNWRSSPNSIYGRPTPCFRTPGRARDQGSSLRVREGQPSATRSRRKN